MIISKFAIIRNLAQSNLLNVLKLLYFIIDKTIINKSIIQYLSRMKCPKINDMLKDISINDIADIIILTI